MNHQVEPTEGFHATFHPLLARHRAVERWFRSRCVTIIPALAARPAAVAMNAVHCSQVEQSDDL